MKKLITGGALVIMALAFALPGQSVAATKKRCGKVRKKVSFDCTKKAFKKFNKLCTKLAKDRFKKAPSKLKADEKKKAISTVECMDYFRCQDCYTCRRKNCDGKACKKCKNICFKEVIQEINLGPCKKDAAKKAPAKK